MGTLSPMGNARLVSLALKIRSFYCACGRILFSVRNRPSS